jgi:hypothetical protein
MSSNVRSQSKNKSKGKNNSIISTLEDEEKIDQLMKDITLKKPRNAYTQFVLKESEKLKSKNDDTKIVLKEFSSTCAEKWKKLGKAEKKQYIKLYEDEKTKYKNDLELVRHFLFKDFNDTVRSSPTAYRIFLNEKLREGFDKNYDPKEVKKDAAAEWAKMSNEEKQVYKDKKKENDNWFQKAQKIKKITPIALFIQKKIEEAKESHKEPPQLKDIAPAWKKLSKNEKKSFEKYAQELNEEKERLQDLYEITHGVKPKRPKGAYRIFLQEKAKNNEIKSLAHGHELWNKLSEQEKEEYFNKSHRCQLAYKYKSMIYKKQIKKMIPKKPGGAIHQYLKEKKGQKAPNGENWLTYWRTMYSKLTEEQKKKYEEKAEKAQSVYLKKMELFNNKVFDMPKKPHSAFTLFLSDRMPELKKEKPDETTSDLLKLIAKEWQEGEIVDHSAYNKNAEKDKKRFKKQLAEFKKNGYYLKDKEKEDDEDEKSKKSKSSKKRTSSSKSSSKNSKKGNTSKPKKEEDKSRSKSKKKTQKSGKTQKSQKSQKSKK